MRENWPWLRTTALWIGARFLLFIQILYSPDSMIAVQNYYFLNDNVSGDLQYSQYCIKYCGWAQGRAQLDFCVKEVFNQVGERSAILKIKRLREDRIYWQWTKRQSGHIPKCMAQALVVSPNFWFDVPLKVLWPILTCGQWLNAALLTQSSLLWYIVTKRTVWKYSVEAKQISFTCNNQALLGRRCWVTEW